MPSEFVNPFDPEKLLSKDSRKGAIAAIMRLLSSGGGLPLYVCMNTGTPVVSFTAHNIRLDDGTYTKPDAGLSLDVHPWFLAAKRVLDATFPGEKAQLRIADLGCLEGGYTVEFARLGFQALGLDVREPNIEACRYVQSRVNLPNLEQ